MNLLRIYCSLHRKSIAQKRLARGENFNKLLAICQNFPPPVKLLCYTVVANIDSIIISLASQTAFFFLHWVGKKIKLKDLRAN